MCFTATVENDIIKLPPGVHLPDGTKVSIEPEKVPPAESELFMDSIRDLIGSIKDAPADLAAEHDHYAHGAPKGTDRQ